MTVAKEDAMKGIGMAMLAGLLVVGLTPPAWALFESDKTLSESAQVPMDQAIAAATKTVPGRAIEADLGKHDGRIVYEIEILDSGKRSRTVYVDAQNGQVRASDRAEADTPSRRGHTGATGSPRNSQPGTSGTDPDSRGKPNSGSTQDGGSGDRIHSDQNQGGRS
jgi:peptidase YpeB-like protein